MSMPPVRQRLSDGRYHFSHGPIDLVIDVTGEAAAVARALDLAWKRFETVLGELVGELAVLRRAFDPEARVDGPVARRMTDAGAPFAPETFVTPMAAVAGAVADEICETIDAAGPFDRIHVNNGGDIALRLRGDARLRVGLVPDIAIAGVTDAIDLAAGDRVGGVATSGRHGRSLSLGIADAVTVLAADAASADVAATLIANAVNVESPRIQRRPAVDLDPDSDLGNRLVTVGVGPLSDHEIAKALEAGASRAHEYMCRGLIRGAALYLESGIRVVAEPGSRFNRLGEAA